MSSESDLNQRIAIFLLAYFLKSGVPSYRFRMKAEVAVNSGQVGVRVPDLVMYSKELSTGMEGARRSQILMDMPPPLVLEVVSLHQASRDYNVGSGGKLS